MYYKYQASFVYHYKPLVLKIEIDFNVIMWYHEQMSFDLAAHFYSREVCSRIQGLNVSFCVAVSNILSFGCSEATIPVPTTPGRNYVVISVSVHSR